MHELLKQRLASELPAMEAALKRAVSELPDPVRPVAQHILCAGGKRLRPLLTVLFARLLGYGADDIYLPAAAMEMLHAATLLHDDVLDEALTRRGKDAAHVRFGAAPAILAGDALLSWANALVAGIGNPRLSVCFSEATVCTAAGEILEIAYQGRVDQEESVYIEIITGKTAWLIRASCEMGALMAGAEENELERARCYGLQLGMAFQMVDDALDFAPPHKTGKPSCGDVREGKLTPPLALYRKSLTPAERDVFDKSFSTRSFDAAEVEKIGACIRELGFDKQARTLAARCLEDASAALFFLPDAPERAVLDHMIRYVRDRKA